MMNGELTMRHKRIRWMIAAGLVLGLTTAAAQTCLNDIKATAPDSRFTDNGNFTVTDRATGLIWKQCAEGLIGAGCATGTPVTFTWQQALHQAADAVFAGSTLWRLPNKNELASLIERRCYDPAINARYFPNTPDGWFWSSSPYAYYSYHAWYVDFGYGYVSGFIKDNAFYVRLVRGGQ